MKALFFLLAVCFVFIPAAAFAQPVNTGHTHFQMNTEPMVVVGTDLAKIGGRAYVPPSKGTKGAFEFPDSRLSDNGYAAWSIDTATGEIAAEGAELPEGLSENLKNAVNIAPEWLRVPLLDRFLGLTPNDAEELADMIQNPEDDRYTDELAFLVAMSGERDLNYTYIVELLEENVRLIYEYDALLDYVEVVDYGQVGDDDYYTTVSYTVLDEGVPTDYELPKEIYYYYIVHPKLDGDNPKYIDPSTGKAAGPSSGGVFWRDYFINDAEGQDSYVTPYFLRNPNVISDTYFSDWSSVTDTYITSRSVYNIDAILHQNGEPVLVEISHPEVNAKGTMIVTTIDVEGGCNDGHCELLENLLSYGPGDMLLPTDSSILIVNETGKITSTAIIENTLTTLGYTFVTTISYTDFLSPTYDDLSPYDKIIVPGWQTHDVYAALSQDVKGHPNLYTWLKDDYRVLEFHLATAGDISDLSFIGDHQVAAAGSAPTTTVTFAGRPYLFDIITTADHVWDGDIYGGLSGNRPFSDDGTMALRLLGNWAGKNMMDNVSEYQGKTNVAWGAVERAIQPVRIIWNHFGNCGELQDVWTALLRTCLLPGLNVSNINEDHVWNEFYHDGQWYYLQNDWSNGATRIATEGGGQDTDYGGGKTVSFIFGWDGNGEVFSVVDRYSNSVILNVEVTDAAGKPVPGATIWIGSEGYYSGSNSWSFFIFTDAEGKAQTTLGDGRNYYLRISSSAGYFPDTSTGHYVQVIDEDDALPGEIFTYEQTMDDPLGGSPEVEDNGARGENGMYLTFDINDRFQHLSHIFNSVIFTRFIENTGVNVYLVDGDNYLSCAKGDGEYTVQQAWEGVTSFDEEIYPPNDGKKWYVVVSNKTNPESTMTITVDTEASINPNPVDDDDDDTSDDDDTAPPPGGGDDDDEDEDSGNCGGCE